MTVDEARTGQPLLGQMLAIEIALLTAVLLAFAIIGPFGTYHAGPWPERVLYWGRTLLVGWMLYRPLLWLAERLALRFGVPAYLAWAVAVAAASLPMAVWLWFFGPAIQTDRKWFTAGQYVETYFQVAFIAGAIAAAVFLLRPKADERTELGHGNCESPAVPSPAKIGDSLADRLPPHLGHDVIALKMEDHYVRVHTPRGSALLLMRLRDAIREVETIEGAQVHRSWWVARHAVERIERDGRATRFHLVNGLSVPIARSRMADLRSTGWLQQHNPRRSRGTGAEA